MIKMIDEGEGGVRRWGRGFVVLGMKEEWWIAVEIDSFYYGEGDGD